jgi:hypothetical protein
VLHEVRLALGRERVVARERPRGSLELLSVHAEHVVPARRVPGLVDGGGGGGRRRRRLRGGRRRSFLRALLSVLQVLLHVLQALHRGVRLRGGGSPLVVERAALFFGFALRAEIGAGAFFLPSLRPVLSRPPGVQPRREARVFGCVAQPPDHGRLLVLRERLALPGEHALQDLGARPADDEPHQPPLLGFRKVLLEQRPQLRLLARDVRLQAHAHRRARRLQAPLDVVHGGFRDTRFRGVQRRNQSACTRVLGVAYAGGDA